MSRERLHELRAKSLHHGLDQAEEDELDEIAAGLYRAQLDALPRPTCCQAASRYPAVVFQVSEGHPNGRWHVKLHDFLAEHMATSGDTDRAISYWENKPCAEFCPFCGTTLPKMVRKARPPEPICVILDGGYYCATCDRRLGECLCLPPEAAFEPV